MQKASLARDWSRPARRFWQEAKGISRARLGPAVVGGGGTDKLARDLDWVCDCDPCGWRRGWTCCRADTDCALA